MFAKLLTLSDNTVPPIGMIGSGKWKAVRVFSLVARGACRAI
jgi:hypothetical protein